MSKSLNYLQLSVTDIMHANRRLSAYNRKIRNELSGCLIKIVLIFASEGKSVIDKDTLINLCKDSGMTEKRVVEVMKYSGLFNLFTDLGISYAQCEAVKQSLKYREAGTKGARAKQAKKSMEGVNKVDVESINESLKALRDSEKESSKDSYSEDSNYTINPDTGELH